MSRRRRVLETLLRPLSTLLLAIGGLLALAALGRLVRVVAGPASGATALAWFGFAALSLASGWLLRRALAGGIELPAPLSAD